MRYPPPPAALLLTATVRMFAVNLRIALSEAWVHAPRVTSSGVRFRPVLIGLRPVVGYIAPRLLGPQRDRRNGLGWECTFGYYLRPTPPPPLVLGP